MRCAIWYLALSLLIPDPVARAGAPYTFDRPVLVESRVDIQTCYA
jgi:hypothetical protein